MLCFVAALLVTTIVALDRPANAWATNVSGTISTNTTWTLANSPYVMTGNVTVNAGVTLTIEPGVTVQGNASSRLLTVNGSLSAVGTGGSPIVFTSTTDSAAGQWNGISFGTSAGTSTLDYVDVRYGGDSGRGDKRDGDRLRRHAHDRGLDLHLEQGLGLGRKRRQHRRRHRDPSSARSSRTTASTAPPRRGRALFEQRRCRDRGLGLLVERDRRHLRRGDAPLLAGESLVSGSSIWDNERYGVYILQARPEALGPDGHVAGEPGNALYDNGTFGFSVSEKWHQMAITRSRSLSTGRDLLGPCHLRPLRGWRRERAPELRRARPRPERHLPDRPWAGPALTRYQRQHRLRERRPARQPARLRASRPLLRPAAADHGGAAEGADLRLHGLPAADSSLASSLDARPQPARLPAWPVSTASGSLTETATDLKLAGPGIPFAWTRSYNSRDTTSGGLGTGWTHPYEAKITVANPTTGELEYRAGSGQRTRFTKARAAVAAPPATAARASTGR